MNDEMDKTSEGLNQIMEVINAKGDEGELKEIVEKGRTRPDTKERDKE